MQHKERVRYELRKKEKELRRQRKLLESELQRESAEMADRECSVPYVASCCITGLLLTGSLSFCLVEYFTPGLSNLIVSRGRIIFQTVSGGRMS